MSAARTLAVSRLPPRILRQTGARVVWEDGVRRIIQCCVCLASVRWDGDLARLYRLGWASKGWRTLWLCPDCFVPPKLVVVPTYPVADHTLTVASMRRDAHKRIGLARLIERLAQVEPPRAVAYLRAIVEHMGGSSSAKPWAVMLANMEGACT